MEHLLCKTMGHFLLVMYGQDKIRLCNIIQLYCSKKEINCQAGK